MVLSLYSQALSRSGMVGSLQDTFRALSFALGKYSSAVEKRYREDVAIMGDSSASMGVALGSSSDASSSSSSSIGDEVDSSSSSSSSSEEVVDYMAAAASSSIGGGELFLAGQLAAPSAESLRFAVSALELIGTHDNIFVMGR